MTNTDRTLLDLLIATQKQEMAMEDRGQGWREYGADRIDGGAKGNYYVMLGLAFVAESIHALAKAIETKKEG